MKKSNLFTLIIFVLCVLLISTICFADDGRGTSRGSRGSATSSSTEPIVTEGRVSHANGKAQYLELEEGEGSDLRAEISLVEFEDYKYPNAGQELNAPSIKLKEGFPGTIDYANFIMFQKSIAGKAEKGEEYQLYIRIQLDLGYKFSEAPDALLGGRYENMRIHNEDFGDTLYGFVFEVKIEEPDSIKITEQSPEEVEFLEGSDVKLFVNATGVQSYQWCKYSTSSGPRQVYSAKKIEGATSSEYVIKKAEATLDGAEFICYLTNEDGEASTNKMKLKLKEPEPVKEEPEESKEEVVEKKEEEKEEVKEEKTTPKATWKKADDWALEELYKAAELKIIPSIFDKEDLTKNITRKEFAHVAVKLYEKITGNKATAIANNPFKDTDDVEVLKAFNVGITQGTGTDTFDPDALITREQMATMMTRALTKAGINTSVDLEKATKFSDDILMHDWGRASIYYMSSIEIIKGVGDNLFNVAGNATREQALLISERSAEKFAK